MLKAQQMGITPEEMIAAVSEEHQKTSLALISVLITTTEYKGREP